MYDACFGYQNGDPNLRRMAREAPSMAECGSCSTYRGHSCGG